MLISETFDGRKLKLMPAIIFATTHSFLLLLGSSRVLSDTSSISAVLKIKNNMRHFPLDILNLSKEENGICARSLYSLGVKSLSHCQPSKGKGFIYSICLDYSVSQKEIFCCSPKIHCKAHEFFIKLAALKSVNFCHWHRSYKSELSNLYFFYCSTAKLFVSIDTYAWLHCSSQSHLLEISSSMYYTALCISCSDELSFHSLLVCWWL